MKRIFAVLLAIGILFVFFGCSNLSEEHEENQFFATELPTTIPSTTPSEYTYERFSLFGTSGFNDAIRENPIDSTFALLELGASTTELIRETRRFAVYWSAEIDALVIRLQELLREEDAENLRTSQQAWREYMDANYAFWQPLLEVFGYYDIAYGTLDWGLANSLRMNEFRARAIELMEFYFRLTGEIVFVFEG